MSEWFVRIAGSILGPYDAAELSNMARTGRLGPLDEVSKSRNGKWVEAHYVQGLVFEEAEADLPLSIESEIKNSPSRKQYDKKRFRGRYECGRVELGPTLLDVGLMMKGNGDAHIALFMEDQESVFVPVLRALKTSYPRSYTKAQDPAGSTISRSL